MPALLWGIVAIGTAAFTAAITEGLRFPQSVVVLAFVGAGLTTCAYLVTRRERQADEASLWAATALWLSLFGAAVFDLSDLAQGEREAVFVWVVAIAVFFAICVPYVWTRRTALPHAAAWTLAATAVLPYAFASLLAAELDLSSALVGAVLSAVAGVAAYVFAVRELPPSARVVVLTAAAGLLGILWYEAVPGGAFACLGWPVVGSIFLVFLLGVERADWSSLLCERGVALIPIAVIVAVVFKVSGDAFTLLAYGGGLIGIVAWWLLVVRRLRRDAGAHAAAARVAVTRLRSGAIASATLATAALCGFFVTALAQDSSSARVLVSLRDAGVIHVSETDLVGAMLRDEYLWRDQPIVPKRPAKVESPLDFWTLPSFDWWSGAGGRERIGRRLQADAVGTGLVVAREGRTTTVVLAPEGSPAHAVGIRRGDRILPRQEDQSDGEVSPRKRVFAINFPITMKVVSQDGRERTVELETSMLRDRRVISTATLDAGGQAVGYVALGRFDPVAEREFLDAIRSFRTAGVRRLVVDLRYNPGGLVHSAAGIAGAIVGERGRGRVFARVQHNSRYRDLDHVALLRVPASGGLDAEQLVVITSGASCSASELLINGLRPHLAVAVVGTTTCGKPVGSRVLESGEWAYSVMSFEVRNARGEGSYYKGIAPTCVAPDDLTHDLGDPAEASLREALHYIETGRCSGPA